MNHRWAVYDKLGYIPHIAGRSINEVDLVNYVKSEWEKSGLDSIVVHPYDVLLSYPLQNKSNYVAILNSKGEEEFISQRKEFVIDAEQNDPNVVDPFNAYSPSGEPQGELVYVNYGRVEDFKHLNRTKHIRVVGKICIARYGKIFRGDKGMPEEWRSCYIHAELYGCAGLILYSDPADYTVPWSRVYPDDWFLPSTGAQRGSLLLGSGDPRTPNYPAIKSAWHLPDQLLYTPGIPVTPIGYVDAVKYLEKLTGNEVMEEWRGGLNITYKYGPGFAGTHRASRMKMFVGTHLEVATIHNVVGYIKGEIEPDRYVIFGNHRDAWVFGAIDPSSGTAVLMEMVRAFGKMVKQGWRPRRTLVFCSWGAEEYGLIGSTEWVEEFEKELQFRAVAYLNVDISVQGNYSFRGVGASGLRDVVFEATKLVSNPDPQEIAAGRTKVYDTWAFRSKNNHSESNPGLPNFPSLGSGSDYAPFQHTLGVSSVDLRYTYDKSIGLSSYPVYHSVYETFELVKKFVDPNFAYHQAVGKVWAEVGRRLAESVILPFDCLVWAKDLETKRNELLSTYGQKMVHHGINLGMQ
ncbi:unnamed protein product [Clavelina lepadiformis]|uniref:Uncharacterized protein n=1 Tax=Clavelina lepadiformis TaxID=159417 RepID=A0ABP0GKJ4_CLALP